MSKMMTAVLVSILVSACDDSAAAPSCQQAITHYYTSGCAYFDLQTGAQIGEGDMISRCQSAAAQAPSQCVAKLDDWLTCNDSVPDHATNAQCDCSSSLMTLIECH